MPASTRSNRVSRPATRAMLVLAVTTTSLIGAAGATGVATAAPVPTANHGAVQYSPTITATPGFGCLAVINATKLPQTKAMDYRVKVDIRRFGVNCGTFKLAVDWKNITTGGTGGQIQDVNPDGTITGYPDNILDGFGFAPGAGTVVSTINTYEKYDEAGTVPLRHLSGRATFTLY